MTILEKLVKIIEDNPNCVIAIDNDYWEITKPHPDDFDKWDTDKQDDWYNNEGKLAHSNDFKFNTSWYSHSTTYGFGIAEALKIILNKKDFNLTIEAV
jgi:hypothetical protein